MIREREGEEGGETRSRRGEGKSTREIHDRFGFDTYTPELTACTYLVQSAKARPGRFLKRRQLRDEKRNKQKRKWKLKRRGKREKKKGKIVL